MGKQTGDTPKVVNDDELLNRPGRGNFLATTVERERRVRAKIEEVRDYAVQRKNAAAYRDLKDDPMVWMKMLLMLEDALMLLREPKKPAATAPPAA